MPDERPLQDAWPDDLRATALEDPDRIRGFGRGRLGVAARPKARAAGAAPEGSPGGGELCRSTPCSCRRAPASFRIFAFFGRDAHFVDVHQAAKLGALDTLSLLERGRADEAVDECADLLALGRDVSYPSVLGRVFGVGVTLFSAPVCGLALSAARAAALEGVRAKLFAIRRGTPRFADILQRESLFQQLLLADPDPRLPDGARAFIAEARKMSRTPLDRFVLALFGPTASEGQEAQMAALLDAQRLEWPACADRMKEAVHRSHWNPLVRQDSGFVDLLRRHRDGILELDALACATSVLLERARTGALPRDAVSACPPIEPEAKCGEQGAPLRIVDVGSAPRVSVTLSDGSDYTVPLARAPKDGAAGLVSPR